MKSSLIVGAVTAVLVASATMAPAFTPSFFAPMAFSFMAVQNIQRVFFGQRGSTRRINGYGRDSGYGQGGGQYGSEQYRTRGD